MKELTLDPVRLCPELEHPGIYRCSVLVDELEDPETAGLLHESYGIRITAVETGDSVWIPHITTSLPRITELARLLIRNRVSPTHLRDVVDDWL